MTVTTEDKGSLQDFPNLQKAKRNGLLPSNAEEQWTEVAPCLDALCFSFQWDQDLAKKVS